MGSDSEAPVLGYFRPEEWKQIGAEGRSIRYENSADGRQVELIRVLVPESELADAASLYRDRLQHFSNVVLLLDLGVSPAGRCGNSGQLTLVFEWISSRLGQHMGIMEEESVLILEEVLFGCREIFSVTGVRFELKDDLVMLNRDSEVRVWMDSDLVSNRPWKAVQSEDKQIESAIRLIARHCEGGGFSPSLTARLDALPRPLNFESVLQTLRVHGESNKGAAPQRVPDKKRLGSFLFKPMSKPKFI